MIAYAVTEFGGRARRKGVCGRVANPVTSPCLQEDAGETPAPTAALHVGNQGLEGEMEEPKSEPAEKEGKSKSSRPAAAPADSPGLADPALLLLALWAGAALARLAPNFKWESLPLVAALLRRPCLRSC